MRRQAAHKLAVPSLFVTSISLVVLQAPQLFKAARNGRGCELAQITCQRSTRGYTLISLSAPPVTINGNVGCTSTVRMGELLLSTSGCHEICSVLALIL